MDKIRFDLMKKQLENFSITMWDLFLLLSDVVSDTSPETNAKELLDTILAYLEDNVLKLKDTDAAEFESCFFELLGKFIEEKRLSAN